MNSVVSQLSIGRIRSGQLYIEREIDRQLRERVAINQICHVFGSNGVGKSSLLARAHVFSGEVSIRVVNCDARSLVAGNNNIHNFYCNLFDEISTQLGLQEQFRLQWSNEIDDQGVLWFVSDILIPALSDGVLIAIDELDELLTQDYYSRFIKDIFDLYQSPMLQSNVNPLVFCFISTHPLEAFIKCDGTRIQEDFVYQLFIPDFTQEEVDEFQGMMRASTNWPGRLMTEVYRHVGGHPMMIQSLLLEIVREHTGRIARSDLPRVVEEAANRMINSPNNALVGHISRRLISDSPLVKALDKLELYRDLLEDDGLPYDPDCPTQEELQLTGVATVDIEDGTRWLVERNTLLSNYFDKDWIDKQITIVKKEYARGRSLPSYPLAADPQDLALIELTYWVDEKFCNVSNTQRPVYEREDEGVAVIRGMLYRFTLYEPGQDMVTLQLYKGLQGLGGQLWEQEET